MRRSFHTNFDDDGNLMLTSPVHKEVRLDQNGGSGRVDMKSHLLNRIMDEKRSDSADSDHYKQNKVVKERFYEFYKQAQRTDANYYFNGIRKNLLTKMEKILSPDELCETFEKLYQKASANLKNAKKVWTDEENVFLVSLITYYTQINDEDFNSISDSGWKYIAEMFPAKKQDQIKTKWQGMLKITVTKVPWSTTEDELLSQIIAEKGNKRQWKEIANELNSRSGSDVFRHGKQCRERWINHLDPDINRGAWTLEEDAKLLQAFLQVGKKWAEIAKRVGQRTENSVKNRWNSLMKKYKNEFGFDALPDVSEDNDSWQKKVAQLALDSFSRERVNPSLLQSVSGRTQPSDIPPNRQSAEQNAPVKDGIKQEPLVGFLDANSLNQQQQLHAALLAQVNNGFNTNFGNQNLFSLNPIGMSPLGRNQFPGQFSGVGTPQNQVQQSPNFDGFLPNWQNMHGVSGMSPMNQSMGGYSPMSNFAGFVGFQGYPNFQNMSNMQQILQNQAPLLNANTPTNSGSGDLLGLNNPGNKTSNTQSQGRTHASHLGVIRESHREDKSDKASRAESMGDNQIGGAEMLLKERPFEDFPENVIENHNLQFAVVDLTKNEVFYITNVTKENFASSVTTMRNRDNNYWGAYQPTSLDLTSQPNGQFNNSLMSLSNINNINSLNQDMANLIITPKPESKRENDPTSSPSIANLIQMNKFSMESEKELYSSKELDQNFESYRRLGRPEENKGGYHKQQMDVKESEHEDMSMESLKNIGDSIGGL